MSSSNMSTIFEYNPRMYPALLVTALVITALHFIFRGIDWIGVLMSAVLFCMYGGLGIVTAFHRYHAHRSFEWRHPILKWTFTLLGCMAGQGSPTGWVAVHRTHHKHADKAMDPHNPHGPNGIFGVPVSDKTFTFRPFIVREMLRDPFLMFLHRYYMGLLAVAAAVLVAGGGIAALVYGMALPMIFTTAGSTFVVAFGHGWMAKWTGAYRNFDTPDNSHNTLPGMVLAFGDGLHNNHHAYETLPRLDVQPWEFDIAGWLIEKLWSK